MQLKAGERLGPYEIVGAVGAGGMGEVYKARDTRLERSVALKILPSDYAQNPQFKQRFEREAKTISQLNHPHICALYDVGDNYIVMELLEGESLADRLARGPLPLRDTLKYAVQIADALDRAHRAGIVHRDLKPGNVMITRSGAKLLDFGLAKNSTGLGASPPDDATQHKPLTEEGMLVGTFHYMAPEQVESGSIDHRTDIFAFGAVLYEMVTGRRAFEGKTKASVIAAVLEHEPPSIRELQPVTPPALERLIRTSLDKDPEERWQSAHDIRRELEWIQTGLSSPPEAETLRRTSSGRSRLARTAAILALAMLAAFAGWFAANRRNSGTERRIVSSIVPPDGTHFVALGDAGGPITLSPDGRFAVFTAFGKNGAVLWLQTLESGSAVPLRGTEKGMFPFWSPDSRSIGFFTSSKLMVTDVDGSSPRVLADAPDARGGCWGEGGEILFAPFTRAPIHRVPSSGGTAVAVTKLQMPYTTHRWPAFLPGGKRFVYLAATHAAPEAPETAVFLASIDGRLNQKLINSPTSAFPFGEYLVFAAGGKLIAQRLTEDRLEGPRTTLWESVLTDPGTWRTVASVSSNGLLATFRNSAATLSRLVWVDRVGKELGEITPEAIYRDVSLSPDGSRVALAIGDPMAAIYIHDIVKGVRSRFSFVPGTAGSPAWTPDGKNIVFDSFVSSDHYEVYVKPAEGGRDEQKIFESPLALRTSDVAPDGRVIIDTNQSEIIAVPLSGGSASTIVGGADQQSAGKVSPDGRWILYVNTGPAGRTAFVAPYPRARAKWQLTGDVVMSGYWTSGGREIIYLSADGQMKSVAVSTQGESIELGAPVPLFRVNVNTNRRSISISADGSRFLIIDPRIDQLGAATLVTHFDLPLR